jgi:hypothetical protein
LRTVFVDGDAGVVDQDVESAVLVEYLAHDAGAVVVGADVAVVHGRTAIAVLVLN